MIKTILNKKLLSLFLRMQIKEYPQSNEHETNDMKLSSKFIAKKEGFDSVKEIHNQLNIGKKSISLANLLLET
jgi:hypothetical protein